MQTHTRTRSVGCALITVLLSQLLNPDSTHTLIDRGRLVTRCGEIARPGYNSGRAHEYLDEPEVLRAKVKVLADMFRKAKKPVLYAGAGLSTSSGINDYATRGLVCVLRSGATTSRM